MNKTNKNKGQAILQIIITAMGIALVSIIKILWITSKETIRSILKVIRQK